jgi:hypothetical protein
MRYDIADSYIPAEGGNNRYVGFKDIQGVGLDNTAEAPIEPTLLRSRFGNAAEGRGVSQSQILVNGMISPPARQDHRRLCPCCNVFWPGC